MMKFIKDIGPYILIVLVVVIIRSYIVTPIKVNGSSMNNTLYDGEIMILKKYEKNTIDRFDIVVVKYENEKLIKRVIGLPSEDIEYKDNDLYINDKKLAENYSIGKTEDFKDYCGKDEYFVMGDNRENSKDSRIIGCVNKDQILGTTDLVIFPFSKMGIKK